MDDQRIEVTTQVIGETDASLLMMPVWVELVEERLKAKEIIARIVEKQVHELLDRRELRLSDARRILNRQYMSQDDIDAQIAATGSVHYPSDREIEKIDKHIDIPVEIDRALDAFKHGRIVMFVDSKQIHRMDEEITIASDTRIKFIRLTPLVGG
jgi:hypothetical protein